MSGDFAQSVVAVITSLTGLIVSIRVLITTIRGDEVVITRRHERDN